MAATSDMTSARATPIIPAVHYAAKSTQDRHLSIPTQLDDCREKSAAEGWTCAGVDEFHDEGFSAYSGNRGNGLAQAKARAVELAREHGRCMLVAQAADRFARGSGDAPGAADALVEIWHQLRRQGVELRSAEDDFDLRDSASVANLGHRAHMDSRRKSNIDQEGSRAPPREGHAQRRAAQARLRLRPPRGRQHGQGRTAARRPRRGRGRATHLSRLRRRAQPARHRAHAHRGEDPDSARRRLVSGHHRQAARRPVLRRTGARRRRARARTARGDHRARALPIGRAHPQRRPTQPAHRRTTPVSGPTCSPTATCAAGAAAAR